MNASEEAGMEMLLGSWAGWETNVLWLQCLSTHCLRRLLSLKCDPITSGFPFDHVAFLCFMAFSISLHQLLLDLGPIFTHKDSISILISSKTPFPKKLTP